MPKKHAHFWLDITLRLKYKYCYIEKCRLNYPRLPTFATDVRM